MSTTDDSDGPRLAITDDDLSALIVLTTATLVAWTVAILTIRIASKLTARISIGLEEVAITISSVFGIACSAAIFAGVKFGLGKSEDLVEDDLAVSKAIYAADILYVFTLWFSKGATILLTLRLTPSRQHRYICYALGGFVSLWAIVSIFIVAIRSPSSAPWLNRGDEPKSDLLARWVGIEVVSLVIEVFILGLATYIILMLQMSMRSKCKVIFAFMTRLPVVAPIALRLMYLSRAFSPSSDFTLTLTPAVICTQAAMHYTVMAASFAYLKPFLSAFDSNLGGTVKLDTAANTSYPSQGQHSKQMKSNGGYSLKNMNSSHSHGHMGGPGGGSMVTSQTGGDQIKREREERRRQRDSSQDSDAPIILKTQTFEVRTEQRGMYDGGRMI